MSPPLNGVGKLHPRESLRRSLDALAETRDRLRRLRDESAVLAARQRQAPHVDVAAAPRSNHRSA